jgi:hypothetical protein
VEGLSVFANSILDVVIGLVFVFFVCSLAVSGINELVRKILNTRAKALWTAISRMLDESELAPQSEGVTARLNAAPARGQPVLDAGAQQSTVAASLAQRLFDHPAIGRLDPARLNKPSKISHIPPTDFARALVDILTPDDDDGNKQWDRLGIEISKLPRPLRSQFQLLYEEAEGNVLRFRQAIEGWFDNGMGRVSTWYKKRTRVVMFAYGLCVAILFNVSAVNVTTELYTNDVVRATVVELAATQGAQENIQDCSNRKCIEAEVGKLVATGLPVLWRTCSDQDNEDVLCGFEDAGAIAATISGWLITAAALSVGAAFWFALLKRAFRLRSHVTGTTG